MFITATKLLQPKLIARLAEPTTSIVDCNAGKHECNAGNEQAGG